MTTPSALQQRMASYLERDGYEITFEDKEELATMTNRVEMTVRNPALPTLGYQAWLVSYTSPFTGRTRHYAALYSPYGTDNTRTIPATKFSFHARIWLGATK